MGKNSKIIWFIVLALSLTLAACNGGNTGQASRTTPSFYFAGPSRASVGSTADYTINTNNIANVYGYQFEIQYNPTYFEFVELIPSTALTQLGYPSTVFCINPDTSVRGRVSKIACTRTGKIGGVTLTGPLYVLRMRSILRGTSTISITNPKAVNPDVIELPRITGGSLRIRAS